MGRPDCAALVGGAVEFADEVLACDGSVDQAAEAFAGVLVENRPCCRWR
jgi:hypothetical protein